MTGFRARIDYILKHYKTPYLMYKYLFSWFFRFIGVFIPIKEKTILFTGHGRHYNDSSRAIYEYMLAQKKYQAYHYIWALDNPDEIKIPGNCQVIKSDTWKYFTMALSCQYWVSCVNIERGLKFKKRKTRYLNTWHGTPIKSISNTDARTDDNFSYIDLFCVAGEYEKKQFKKAFSVREDHLLFTGLPRNDELYYVTKEQIDLLRKSLSIPPNKKVLLYAPTWRDSVDSGTSYTLAPPINFKKWEEKLSDKYVLLLRTHPYTNKLMNVQFNDFVRDVTSYPQINDLLMISDILISDYSATIFDFSILERPIICFGYDIEEYANSRGFALDPSEEVPGGVLKTEDEVLYRIVNCNYEKESAMTRSFKNKYLEYGGHARKQCVEALLNEEKA